jgi:hypothetical protein
VDMIQVTLGQALLVLAGIAVVLFAVILLLVEANYIIRLSKKLSRRLRSGESDPTGPHPASVNQGKLESSRDRQGSR